MLRVLGPIEVSSGDRRVEIGPRKLRALLAALSIRRGATCTTDELIDDLWGEAPPPSAPKLLQVYVSQLRRLLPDPIRVVTRPTGYALELEPAAIDAVRFERLVGEGRAALRAGNPTLSAALLARGLALWRGPAYADVRYEPFAAPEIERLERLRDIALDDRLEADLRLGRHATILGELRALLASDPTNERRAALAMTAAYRTSGRAEALAIFAATRAALRAELDAEPGAELVELHDRIARGDPALAAQPVTAPGRTAVPLPLAPNALIGRARELAELRTLLARPDVRFVSLTGAGGSGKSRLALELAREVAPDFANGAVLVDLAPLPDPALVPAAIARGLGLEPGADAMATLLEAVGGLEVLLLLDNMEHLRPASAEVVRLLAAGPRLVVLATTRVVLHASGEHVYPVPPLAEGDAVTLFAERARARDPSFDLDPTTFPLVTRICRRLDRLPLLIELAAARVHALGLGALDSRLASRLSILADGPRDVPARQQTLRDTLAWSVNLLSARDSDVLGALAVFPASFSMEAAAAVAGADDDAITTLVDHNLLQAFDQGSERRFRLLETVREYASDVLLGPRRETVEAALTAWAVQLVRAAVPDSAAPMRPDAYERFDTELDTIRVALRQAARNADPADELAIASRLWKYWWVRGLLAEGRAICRDILARRGLVPTQDGIRTARAAASLAWSMGDLDEAEALAEEALGVAHRLGDTIEEVSAHNVLGAVARSRRSLAVAERHFATAMSLAQSIGNLELVNMYRMNLGAVYLDGGRLDAAREVFEAVLDFRRDEGLSQEVGITRLNLGQTEYEAGNLEVAEAHFAIAVEALRSVGFKARLANALQGLAAVEAGTGRAESAARRLGSAATILATTGWAAGDSPLELAAASSARAALGDETFDRLFAEGAAGGA